MAVSNNHPILVVDKLSKSYGKDESRVDALKDASLTVNASEFVALMGASGSGKSTLLHLIAGIGSFDSGTVTLDGQSIGSLSDSELTILRRRKIGLVFQSYNLIPSLTAEENITLPSLLDSSARIDSAKLDALLDALGIKTRRTHRPDALSGGEQQRVAIGRALFSDPAILLADEPTGNLDTHSGKEICDILKRLSQTDKRTILLVTHDPAVALIADRIAFMNDGRIIGQATAGDYQNAIDVERLRSAAVTAAVGVL